MTDTAGLRDTEDLVEAEGVRRARQAAHDADIVVAVADVAAQDHDAGLFELASSLAGQAGTSSTANAILLV